VGALASMRTGRVRSLIPPCEPPRAVASPSEIPVVAISMLDIIIPSVGGIRIITSSQGQRYEKKTCKCLSIKRRAARESPPPCPEVETLAHMILD
jgi:hypothetical protein